MKLTKKILKKKIQDKLIELGYIGVSDSASAADLLYIKRVENKFYLTLGLTISNYYDTRFTGAFYLSKSTIWSAIWGDIPKKSYVRIGKFLQPNERRELLSDEFNKVNVMDAWWDGDDDNSINSFISAVEITEKRFINQPNLFLDIENSNTVNEIYTLSQKVIKELGNVEDDSFVYKFVSDKPILGIPKKWIMSAEKVLSDSNNTITNRNTVVRLAVDAWRQNTLLMAESTK